MSGQMRKRAKGPEDQAEGPSKRAKVSTDTRPSLTGSVLFRAALVPGLRGMIKKGSLRISFGAGEDTVLGDGTGVPVELHVHSERFLWGTLLDPGMGLADSYVAGDISVKPDIIDLFNLTLANKPKGDEASPMSWSPMQLITPLAKRYYASLHAGRANSQEGSQKNIAAHYDLSNAMFQQFLSKDMTYSAGIFDKEVEDLQKMGASAEAADRKSVV